jgi:two-component system cell cycle sensor histidine kinase/response regulator CckA
MSAAVQAEDERQPLETDLLRTQRLECIGALADGLAHGINNALSPVLLGTELIQGASRDPDTRQKLTRIETNTRRGAGLVRQLLRSARGRNSNRALLDLERLGREMQSIDLALQLVSCQSYETDTQHLLEVMAASTRSGVELIRQVLRFARGRDDDCELLEVGRLVRGIESLLRRTLPSNITLSALVPPDLWPVLGNATQLLQVLLRLGLNARDAMPKGGDLTLAADNVESIADETNGVPQPHVLLLVSDTRAAVVREGDPPSSQPAWFINVSSKEIDLQFVTIAQIVRNHGGFVCSKNEPGAGTTFENYFPRAETRASCESHRPYGLASATACP